MQARGFILCTGVSAKGLVLYFAHCSPSIDSVRDILFLLSATNFSSLFFNWRPPRSSLSVHRNNRTSQKTLCSAEFLERNNGMHVTTRALSPCDRLHKPCLVASTVPSTSSRKRRQTRDTRQNSLLASGTSEYHFPVPWEGLSCYLFDRFLRQPEITN